MPDAKPKSNRGGKRAGAGRKPKGYVSPSKLGDIDLRAVLEGDIPEQIESEAQRHALVVVTGLRLHEQAGEVGRVRERIGLAPEHLAASGFHDVRRVALELLAEHVVGGDEEPGVAT